MIITLVLAAIIVLVNITCLIKLCCFYRKFVFETIILFTQIIEAIFIFISSFWKKMIAILLTRNFLGLITFALIAFSFMKMHFRIRNKPHLERASLIFHVFFIASNLAFFLIGVQGENQVVCEGFEKAISWNFICWSRLLLIMIMTLFGICLIKDGTQGKLQQNTKNIHNIEEDDQPSSPFMHSEMKEMLRNQNFYKTQKRQLLSIIISYSLFNIFNFCWEISYLLRFPSDLQCLNDQDYIFSTLRGNILFFIKNFLDLCPCLVLPYVFYYIPIGKTPKTKDFYLKKEEETSSEAHKSFLSYNERQETSDFEKKDNFIAEDFAIYAYKPMEFV